MRAVAGSPSRSPCRSGRRRRSRRGASAVDLSLKLRAVLWDLDGTLTDSVRFVVDTANQVIAAHGGTPLDFADVGRMTGLPIEDIFRAAWPDLSDADAVTYRTEYRAIYDEVAIPATRLYRGALTTLRAFRQAGLRQATVTGKSAEACERILRGLGLVREIDAYLGGDSAARPKPAPDLALAAMERLGVTPAESAVIGDTRTDMRMARASGALAVQVLWGVESERVPEADVTVRTWVELRERILRS